MASNGKTAEEAFQEVNNGHGVPIGKSSAYVCPYTDCGVLAQHTWATITQGSSFLKSERFSRNLAQGATLVCSLCEACGREVIFLNGRVIAPAKSDAVKPADDMPSDVAIDFEEARQIFHQSPRGAAALLRLAIQKLCKELGSSQRDINAAIGELVRAGKINADIQRALDSVRVIGNEAVHPGVMDLKDDVGTARALFGLVNFIVEKGISEPKRIAELYSTLPPGKLAGIVNRDAQTSSS